MKVLLKVQSSNGHPSSDSFWQMLLFQIAKGFPHCITRRSFYATLFLRRTSLHGFYLHFSRLRKRRISQIDFFFTLDTAPHGHFLGLYEQQVHATAGSKGDAFFSFLLLFLSCLLSFLGLYSDFLFSPFFLSFVFFVASSSSSSSLLSFLFPGSFLSNYASLPLPLSRWLLFEIVSTHSFFLSYLVGKWLNRSSS